MTKIDLFPGFATRTVETSSGHFHVRAGGDGPPLLLLHGYPQTHAEWHKITHRLAERYSVVLMDLRGYGASFVPEDVGTDGEAMSKRAMGQDAVDVMAALGHRTFRLVGHDRGGRVAYRLAFDQPGRLEKIAVIDIIPTASMFRAMGEAKSAIGKYHWLFLAQPAPFPETMIGASPLFFLEHRLAQWTARKDLSSFDEAALSQYRDAFADPARIHATCEDYRAAAFIDRPLDEADLKAGRTIDVPMLVLWVKRASRRRAFRRSTSGATTPATYAARRSRRGISCRRRIPTLARQRCSISYAERCRSAQS